MRRLVTLTLIILLATSLFGQIRGVTRRQIAAIAPPILVVNHWNLLGKFDGTTVYPYSIAPAAGNTLVAVIYQTAAYPSVATIVDNSSNAFVADAALTAGGNANLRIYRLTNIGTVTGITVTLDGANRFVGELIEVSGLGSVSPLDVIGTDVGHSSSTYTTWTTSAITTTVAKDLVLGISASGYRPTYGAGSNCTAFAYQDSNAGMVLCYQIESAIGSYAPSGPQTLGSSFSYVDVAIAYKGQ